MTQRLQQDSRLRTLLLPLVMALLVSASLSCNQESAEQDTANEKMPRVPIEDGTPGATVNVSKASFDFDLTGLPPRLRDELQNIKALVIKDSNANDIWLLSDHPERVDLLILTCSPTSLSTDMITLVKQWASEGRGVVVTKGLFNAVWPHLFPKGFVPIDYGGPSRPLPVEGQAVTAQVSKVNNFLWCSANYGYAHIFRAGDVKPAYSEALTHAEITDVLAQEGEEFSPIVVHDDSSLRGIETYPLILFTTTWNGARIAWLVGTIEDSRKYPCKQVNDDARLWSNLAHWLAGK